MDRQLPNFNIFLNPQSNIKPTQQQKTNNNNNLNNNFSNQQQQHQQFTLPSYLSSNNQSTLNQLPQTPFPTTTHPILFYKTKDRLTSNMLTSRIGYRVRQYPRVQQDYICYLTQLIMTQCAWLKIFIIEPNYLYVQVSSMSVDKECGQNINDRDNQRQQVQLQNKLLKLIKQISQQLINPWLDAQLKPQKLTSQQFDQQKFIQLFQKQVITKIKTKYQQSLAIGNNKRK